MLLPGVLKSVVTTPGSSWGWHIPPWPASLPHVFSKRCTFSLPFRSLPPPAGGGKSNLCIWTEIFRWVLKSLSVFPNTGFRDSSYLFPCGCHSHNLSSCPIQTSPVLFLIAIRQWEVLAVSLPYDSHFCFLFSWERVWNWHHLWDTNSVLQGNTVCTFIPWLL